MKKSKVKKDPRTMIHLLPYYLERLNKIAEVENRKQREVVEFLIDNWYEDLVARNLIKEL